MATSVTFYLKKPNQRKSTLIYLAFRFNHYEVTSSGKKIYKTLRFSTGEKIDPKYWDDSTYSGKSKNDDPDFTELNQRICEISIAITDIYRRLVNDGTTVTIELLKQELSKQEVLFQHRKSSAIKSIKPKEKKHDQLFGFLTDHIENVKTYRFQGKIRTLSERTRKKYKTTNKILKEFADKRRSGKLDFDDLNMIFYEEFIEFMQKKLKYGENTIGKHIATLKALLNQATEKGFNKSKEYKKFSPPTEEVDKIYLREDELTKIYTLDLSHSPHLDRVRDLFIIGCSTALRFSDFTNIQPENISSSEGGQVLKINTQKTLQKVVIPLHWRVKKILEKYNDNLPRSISNQKMNLYLKDIGQLAGIDEKISITKTIAGITRTTTKPKYKLISTHTGRRTGATNMYLAGIPVHSIMKITGHKTERSFLRYLRFTEEDNARILQKSTFFSDNKKSNLRAI